MTAKSTKKKAAKKAEEPTGDHCDACKVTVDEELQKLEAEDGSGAFSNVCSGCYEAEVERRHKRDAAKEAAAAAAPADDQVDEDIEDDEGGGEAEDGDDDEGEEGEGDDEENAGGQGQGEGGEVTP